MPNLLVNENSPYLLQHKDNPVEWYPWGAEALRRAREENKPIFLSIGYAACHWCHVMEKESFEDAETAAIMNRYFINIKVDREERPDLDNLYMNAVVAMTGHGGWPLSIFLTPDGAPFFGGTYFPPVRRYNLPSFREVLLSVAQVWQNQPHEVLKSSQQLVNYLRESTLFNQAAQSDSLSQKTLEKATEVLLSNYDWINGGWGNAPKFPQPMAIEFLLQRAISDVPQAGEAAFHALNCMAKGGMYDVIGGGFARYSTDAQWCIPHFEKMLYDNAQLSLAYLHGYLVSGHPYYRQVCEKTLDFMRRELFSKEGGFFSSLDADSEGEEGKFYVWTVEQIREALGNENDYRFFSTAYEVSEKGNFEGKIVLHRIKTDEELADHFHIPPDEVLARLDECHERLFRTRSQRLRPATDDKALVSWNALALMAFSEAGRYLGRPDYLETARKNAHFLLTELHPGDRLLRSWRAGKPQHNAYLEDYAALILGLLSLYQTDFNVEWFKAASRLTQAMVEHFYDPQNGFYDTRNDHEIPIMRPREIQDNAIPSGNALAVAALLKMAAYTGKGEWRSIAEKNLHQVQSLLERYPTAFAFWLTALAFALAPVQEIALIGDPKNPQTQTLLQTLWSSHDPYRILAASNYPPPNGAPSLLENRPMVDNKPTVYICRQWICQKPITDAGELIEALNQSKSRLTGQ